MRSTLALACAFVLVPAAQAGAATLKVSSSGSDSAACSTVAPCASFNRAYQVSQPGDTIEVAGGNYGAQTVNRKHAEGTATVTFRPALGADVTIGSLSNYANEVSYIGLKAAPIGSSLGDGVVSAREGTDVLFNFVSGRKMRVWGTLDRAPVNNTFLGGVWKEQVDCSG